MLLLISTFLFLCVLGCNCFQIQRSRAVALPRKIACSLNRNGEAAQTGTNIYIDMQVNKIESTTRGLTHIIGYDAVYKEQDDSATVMLDSPALKVLGILFNPMALIFALYFVLVGYTHVGSLITNILYTLRLKQRNSKSSNNLEEDLPFQVFECDVCEMQMRPAKGRAAKIFGRERFRCARCGAKASSYFNIDDMSDKRAIARRKRLEEAEANENLDDDEGDGDHANDEY